MNIFETSETSPIWVLPGEPVAADPAAPRLMPRLIAALECSRPMAPGRRLVLDALDRVVVARGAGGRIERAGRTAMIAVTDVGASRQHLAIRRCPRGWQVEDLGSHNGTVVNGESVRVATLADGDLIEVGGAMLMFLDGGPRCDPEDRDLAEPVGSEPSGMSPVAGPAFLTLSVELERRLQQICKIAPSVVPVLVRGETGTGKELVARAIHDASGRPGPFVPVNCGALPRDLLESELFGHRRGAFSGASEDREGLVRRAHRGTLFLDEVAELPPDSQVALLRVLQDGEVRPVGASQATRVDVRVVAATHQDLRRRIVDGVFRQDLYGRIAGFEVTMPPLRDRREDLGLLIAAILPRVCAEPELVTLHKPAARALFRYPWPLNIRELEQALRAAMALCAGRQIRLEHLPPAIRDYKPQAISVADSPDAALRERLIALLREARGNVSAVARAMDRAPVQIRRWCRRLNIDLAQFRHYAGTR
jgi:transcriptional regulator with AAA-type ATPase domain